MLHPFSHHSKSLLPLDESSFGSEMHQDFLEEYLNPQSPPEEQHGVPMEKSVTCCVVTATHDKHSFAAAFGLNYQKFIINASEKAGKELKMTSFFKINDFSIQFAYFDKECWPYFVDSLHETFPMFGLLLNPNCKVPVAT
jgi:hypothetical protein